MKNRKSNYFFEVVIFLIFLVALGSILIHFSKKPKAPLLNGDAGGKAIQNPPDKNTPTFSKDGDIGGKLNQEQSKPVDTKPKK